MVIEMTESTLPVAMDAGTARRETDEVKEAARDLWRRLARLFNGGAHTALGYESWQAYCAAEFGIATKTAQTLLDAGRVHLAVEHSGGRIRPPDIPSQNVARLLARLLPPTNDQSARTGRNGSDEQVVEAWAAVVKAKAESDTPDTPITESFTRSTLMTLGFIPDTRSGGGTPGWFELVGAVGDHLIAAGKAMDKADKAVTRRPNAKLQDKLAEYADWARTLAGRLDAMREWTE